MDRLSGVLGPLRASRDRRLKRLAFQNIPLAADRLASAGMSVAFPTVRRILDKTFRLERNTMNPDRFASLFEHGVTLVIGLWMIRAGFARSGQPANPKFGQFQSTFGRYLRIVGPCMALFGAISIVSASLREIPWRWTRYRFEQSRFTVELPAVPIEKTHTEPTPRGSLKIHRVASQVHKETAHFQVSSFQLVDPADSWLTLEEAADAFQTQWAPDERHRLELACRPALELVYRNQDKPSMRTQFVAIDDRLYQVSVTAPDEMLNGPEAKRFFRSFRLLS